MYRLDVWSHKLIFHTALSLLIAICIGSALYDISFDTMKSLTFQNSLQNNSLNWNEMCLLFCLTTLTQLRWTHAFKRTLRLSTQQPLLTMAGLVNFCPKTLWNYVGKTGNWILTKIRVLFENENEQFYLIYVFCSQLLDCFQKYLALWCFWN